MRRGFSVLGQEQVTQKHRHETKFIDALFSKSPSRPGG